MSYENYKKARDASWKILIDCGVSSLPVDVGKICKTLGYKLYTYEAGAKIIEAVGLTPQIKRSDGFTIVKDGTPYIFFDSKRSPGRRRFTVAHEIGHIVLGHVGPGQYTVINREPSAGDDPMETQANQLAARLLAPACVLHAAGAETAEQISAMCNISLPAAQFRAQRMKTLNKRHKYLTSPLERKVLAQFTDYLSSLSR